MLEVEYRFLNINKSQIQTKLNDIGAKIIHPECKMLRYIFHKSDNPQIKGKNLRVRKEYNKSTLTFKGDRSENDFIEEIEVNVSDFDNTIKILQNAGLKVSSIQESFRETWEKNDCLITIDTRPHLDPYLEIESKTQSIENVQSVAKALKLDWELKTTKELMELYADKYNKSFVDLNRLPKHLTFDQENPFD